MAVRPDETQYEAGIGPAKQLQLQQQLKPADLAILIAAGLPDPVAQEAAGRGPPPAGVPTLALVARELHLQVGRSARCPGAAAGRTRRGNGDGWPPTRVTTAHWSLIGIAFRIPGKASSRRSGLPSVVLVRASTGGRATAVRMDSF